MLSAQPQRRPCLALLQSPCPPLLTGLATGQLPLTHEALDGHSSPQTAMHLRDLLMQHGVLDHRDRYHPLRGLAQPVPHDRRTGRGPSARPAVRHLAHPPPPGRTTGTHFRDHRQTPAGGLERRTLPHLAPPARHHPRRLHPRPSRPLDHHREHIAPVQPSVHRPGSNTPRPPATSAAGLSEEAAPRGPRPKRSSPASVRASRSEAMPFSARPCGRHPARALRPAPHPHCRPDHGRSRPQLN